MPAFFVYIQWIYLNCGFISCCAGFSRASKASPSYRKVRTCALHNSGHTTNMPCIWVKWKRLAEYYFGLANNFLQPVDLRISAREGTGVPHFVHVSTALCRRMCLQCIDVGHVAVPGIRQGLRHHVRAPPAGNRSGPGKRFSDIG